MYVLQWVLSYPFISQFFFVVTYIQIYDEAGYNSSISLRPVFKLCINSTKSVSLTRITILLSICFIFTQKKDWYNL